MMRSKKNTTPKPVTPIHVELPAPPPPAATPESPTPGTEGQAAVRAATLQQLERFAEQVEQFVESSQLDTLINRLQPDLQRTPETPPMRIRRE
jgi:hypothetical protein